MALEDEEVFYELKQWHLWAQLEGLFRRRLDILRNGLLIPLHEADGQGQGSFISAASFVQGQIRELSSLVGLVSEAERPEVGERKEKKA